MKTFVHILNLVFIIKLFCWKGKLIKNSSVIFPSYLSDEYNSTEQKLTNELDVYFENFTIDGLLLDYNTPLDLSYSRKGNKTCPSSLDQNKWDLYHYSELNENTPCLDLIHKDKDKSTHMSLHNLYGYQHMKMVCILSKQLFLIWIHIWVDFHSSINYKNWL